MEKLAIVWWALFMLAVWLENYTWFKAYSKVKERRANGDSTCAAKQTFYGWRVKEYPRCDF